MCSGLESPSSVPSTVGADEGGATVIAAAVSSSTPAAVAVDGAASPVCALVAGDAIANAATPVLSFRSSADSPQQSVADMMGAEMFG